MKRSPSRTKEVEGVVANLITHTAKANARRVEGGEGLWRRAVLRMHTSCYALTAVGVCARGRGRDKPRTASLLAPQRFRTETCQSPEGGRENVTQSQSEENELGHGACDGRGQIVRHVTLAQLRG